jgi:photosystem II stability/assembly factor-like uncharacterized protein
MVGTPETGLPNARHRILLLDPTSPRDTRRLTAMVDNHGVFVSEDGGRTWQARNSGLPHGDIRGLVRHATQPATYWCALGDDGKQPGAVFRTDDVGKTWRQVSRDLMVANVRALAVAPSDPQRLYLSAANHMLAGRFVRGGLFRSNDGGQTWSMILEDDFVEALAVGPRNADVVYAGLWDAPYHDECTGDGIVMTRDGGRTWASINGTGLTCKRVARIVVDPHDPNRLYLGTTGNGVFVGRVSNP